MVAKTIRPILIIAALGLAGCQTVGLQSTDGQAGTEGHQSQSNNTDANTAPALRQESVAEADYEAPVVSSKSGSESSTEQPATQEPEPSPEQVVIKLQQQALQLQSEGLWAEAELVLDRALRIEADKVDLYHQMATVRMGQERFAEAEQIALKGLTLTNQTADHKALLWEVIAQCRSAMSDIEGAREARSEMLKWMNHD